MVFFFSLSICRWVLLFWSKKYLFLVCHRIRALKRDQMREEDKMWSKKTRKTDWRHGKWNSKNYLFEFLERIPRGKSLSSSWCRLQVDKNNSNPRLWMNKKSFIFSIEILILHPLLKIIIMKVIKINLVDLCYYFFFI
jgi:hypothetical protein